MVNEKDVVNLNICIIVHSETGTTLKFGNMIAEKLRMNGHAVDVVNLETNPRFSGVHMGKVQKFLITNIPDCSKYDILFIGSPVWAFSASPVIMDFIKSLGNITGKKVIPLATMGFPFAFMGGKRSLAMIGAEAAKKGAEILPGKVIPKMFRNPDALMEKYAMEISKFF